MLQRGDVVAIEGITGIGKSNLGQQIALGLADSGITSRWYFELEPENPLVPREQDHRIMESSFHRWKEFLETSAYSTQVSIVDGRLFLINIVWALQYGISSTEIQSRLGSLVELIKDHGVRVIYLQSQDLEGLFEHTFLKRGCEDWYIENCEKTVFCQTHGFYGRNAVVEFYREVDRIMAQLVHSLGTTARVLTLTPGRWDLLQRTVFSSLGIPEPPLKKSSRADADFVVGSYLGTFHGNKARFEVANGDGELLVIDHPFTVYKPVEQRWTLIKMELNTYLGRGQPVKLRFILDDAGEVVGMYHCGMYEEIPPSVDCVKLDGYFERC